jgi:hypothetical protein
MMIIRTVIVTVIIMAIMMATMTAKEYLITPIPGDRRWAFPSVEFKDCRFSFADGRDQ